MGAFFDDLAGVNEKYAIGARDGCKPMGYGDHHPSGAESLDCGAYRGFRFRIESRRRLVEHQHGRVA